MAWGRRGGYGRYGWDPYVPVAQKLAMAKRHAEQFAKKQKRKPAPVVVQGRKIATTFWGNAWCDNLTAYSDFANRLPRGVTYVRNGSVVDLVIQSRRIDAIVAGSEPYTVEIKIKALAKATWNQIKRDCSASIDSLLDLLAGRFSDGVMRRLTRPKDGLFPSPKEIELSCSCPDYSYCCKHLAAVMYSVGNRLDSQPELLFLLRDVDHQELVTQAVAEGNLERELSATRDDALAGQDLGAMFGIELDASASSTAPKDKKSAKTSKPAKVRQPAQASNAAKVNRLVKSDTPESNGQPAKKAGGRTTTKRAKAKSAVLAVAKVKAAAAPAAAATGKAPRRTRAQKANGAALKTPSKPKMTKHHVK